MKNKKNMILYLSVILCILILSCSKVENSIIENNSNSNDCEPTIQLDNSRGSCNEQLNYNNSVTISTTGDYTIIQSNNIPNHLVGLFGRISGSLNPNEIREQNSDYRISNSPLQNDDYISLLSSTSGPSYSFGVLINGVEVDPVAAEPFPHEGMFSSNVNWEWNLEALNVNLGLDCNNAHVQPNGKYHYHGSPVLYLEELNISSNKMTMIGVAADGFPIYYKYAYKSPMDLNSSVIEMATSYSLKVGDRPGDGITAPCGQYNGTYSNDYEFISGLGHLDKANGRFGVSPEYPEGTYYYLITEDFPSIPRYFKGTPSDDFKIGI